MSRELVERRECLGSWWRGGMSRELVRGGMSRELVERRDV